MKHRHRTFKKKPAFKRKMKRRRSPFRRRRTRDLPFSAAKDAAIPRPRKRTATIRPRVCWPEIGGDFYLERRSPTSSPRGWPPAAWSPRARARSDICGGDVFACCWMEWLVKKYRGQVLRGEGFGQTFWLLKMWM